MTTLEIGNLPLTMTDSMLLQMFSPFGATTASIQISANGHPPRACGLVTVPDIFQALTAVATLSRARTAGQGPLSVSIKN